ncbi:MAG: hypothetical protein K0S27_1471 [Gammaproteobacteria bacterium]|jgi:hypothetical protein|nr:hypothetical protein [Gammaproteobacteria bacterium]
MGCFYWVLEKFIILAILKLMKSIALFLFEVKAMFRHVDEKKRSKNALAGEFKKISTEISEAIIQLQAMRDYAQNNHYGEAEARLNDILKIFYKLQVACDSAVNKEINKAKSTLSKAKMSMHSEKEQIFSSLRKSTFQNIFDNMRDFFSAHNKFEALLGKLETLKKLAKEKRKVTSSLQFFTPDSPEGEEPVLRGSKLKLFKISLKK